jgi:hypothetical protein
MKEKKKKKKEKRIQKNESKLNYQKSNYCLRNGNPKRVQYHVTINKEINQDHYMNH